MGLGLVAGAMQGAGEAGVKSGEMLQKQFGDEELLKMKNDAERELQTSLENMRQSGADRRLDVSEAGSDRRLGVSEGGIDRRNKATLESHEREGSANRGVQREQIAEQSRHNKAFENIQAAAEGRLATGAKLDNAIKQIGLDNATRVDALKKEFGAATPQRQKAITEEIQLLTGKDNDNYLPVAIKDDVGNTIGYQIFDRKRGAWVDAPKPGGAGGKPGERPPLDSFFKPKEKPAPSAGGGAAPTEPAAAPREPLTLQQRREAEMRAEYDRNQAEGRKSRGLIEQEFKDNIDRTALRSGM